MKLLQNNVAVIDKDTHISEWVQQQGRLDIAVEMLRPFRKYIPIGGTVLDVGASIGDHTITYAEWVGPTGTVVAFEPNPKAYDCLLHNTKHMKQVVQVSSGLSNVEEIVSIVELDNSGASYLVQTEGDVIVFPLDYFDYDKIDFIKIDVEGFEVKVLEGARDTINRCKPVMLIEVNSGALERSGTSAEKLVFLAASFGYEIHITDPRLKWNSPQYDIICTPINKTH